MIAFAVRVHHTERRAAVEERAAELSGKSKSLDSAKPCPAPGEKHALFTAACLSASLVPPAEAQDDLDKQRRLTPTTFPFASPLAENSLPYGPMPSQRLIAP
jgi:hypothetical protein